MKELLQNILNDFILLKFTLNYSIHTWWHARKGALLEHFDLDQAALIVCFFSQTCNTKMLFYLQFEHLSSPFYDWGKKKLLKNICLKEKML